MARELNLPLQSTAAACLLPCSWCKASWPTCTQPPRPPVHSSRSGCRQVGRQELLHVQPRNHGHSSCPLSRLRTTSADACCCSPMPQPQAVPTARTVLPPSCMPLRMPHGRRSIPSSCWAATGACICAAVAWPCPLMLPGCKLPGCTASQGVGQVCLAGHCGATRVPIRIANAV